MADRRKLIYKLTKTFFLIIVWACLGLFSEITGVTLQDLRERTQTDYERISQAVSMRMAGMGIGAIFGGWLLTKLIRFGDLVIALSLTVGALLCVAIAYTPYVEAMFVEFTIQGIAETFIAIAGQQSLIGIWKEKASAPMHILHCGYGAGSFLVPQIAKPFLSKRIAATSSKFYLQNCLNTTEVNEVNSTNTIDMTPENNHFEYSYLIVMGIVLVIAGVFFAYFWLDRKDMSSYATTESEAKEGHEPTTLKQMLNFNSCSPGHPWYAGIIFSFLVVWFYVAVGGQMVFANYLYSYAKDFLCLSKDTAADIQSTFWIGFTAGRFAGFVAAIWIPMKALTFIEAGGNMISAIVIYGYSSNVTVIWVFSCISGFFVGPIYPTGIAWANRYITLTGIGYTITLIGAGMAGVSFTVAVGWFFEHSGPQPMLYFVLGYSALACGLAIAMHLVARTRGDKYEREKKEAQNAVINADKSADSQF